MHFGQLIFGRKMYNLFLNAESAVPAAFNGTGIFIFLDCAAVIALLMVSRFHIFEKLGFSGGTGLIPFRSDFLLYRTFWNKKPFFCVDHIARILFAYMLFFDFYNDY